MKATILYESDEKSHSAERFLSKEELRRIFGSGISIALTITKERKRYRLNHGKDNGGHVKIDYPVFRQKGREVHL
jgi:hypothetical protein